MVKILNELRMLEFDMQMVWGFELNHKKHIWKHLIPNSPFPILRGSWAAMYIRDASVVYG